MKIKGSLEVGGGFNRPFVHFQYQLDSGTVGGNMTAAAWNTRNLNTVVYRNFPDIVQSGGAITMPPGLYYMEAYAATFRTGKNKLRIRDTLFGDGVYLIGISADANTTDGNSTAYVGGRLYVTRTTDIAVEHYITTNTGTSDAGTPTSATAISEVYADVKIWVISPLAAGVGA